MSLSRKVHFVTTKALDLRQRHPMIVSWIACAIESDVKSILTFRDETQPHFSIVHVAPQRHTPLTVLATLVDLDQFFWLPVHFSKNKAFFKVVEFGQIRQLNDQVPGR